MLTGYYEMARVQIESFGGVVEKFIGDAVVGVFGVPAAHEDDPERAVRAGLRIVERSEQLTAVGGGPLLLRVGVNTGEALVRLDVTPGSGEGFLVGDAINTASRIQSVAPALGVAVGRRTFEATEAVFDYAELVPASVKGKSDLVAAFHAKSPVARFGADLTRTHDSLFVGREIDLALLRGIFDKTVAAESVQLVTVVGEPGLGKSRIVAELFNHVDSLPGLITWRQGRCLPYGEGITFWPLGEIVKAHAGILDTDPPGAAVTKLDAVLPEGSERPWFRQRLLPLLGIEATSTAEREELFTAWRRFLEHIAERHPTVVVLEDLHWADLGMLAFIEHLADHAEAVPLLVVGTARPEFFERHSEYAVGWRNTTTINLAPLSEAETARLVTALLDATVLPAELQSPIVQQSGGNPLYAGEFVRLLRDRDLIASSGASWELKPGSQVPLPDSVQAVIAARLDTLEPETKSLLADAAVVGKVFWAGAVAAMSERGTADVVEVLRGLSRKELIRPARQSSMAGEAEYAFWHVLTRDVTYHQLPRASRASRHVAAAQWIEAKAAGRVEDLADVLAYHYATALALATAAENTDLAAELETPALRFLTLAGERALGLDTATALANFEQALTLTPSGHPERGAALARLGRAALDAARYTDAAAATEEAVAIFRSAANPAAAATAMGELQLVLERLGDPRARTLPFERHAMLAPLSPGPEMVHALGGLSGEEGLQGRLESAVEYADQALALADQLGLDVPVQVLGPRGTARVALGDRAGLADYQEVITLATEAGQGRLVALAHNNYGLALWLFDGPAAGLDMLRAGIAYATPRGLTDMTDFTASSSVTLLVDSGQHDELLETAARLANSFETSGDVSNLTEVRAVQTRIHTLRGHPELAASWLSWLQTISREIGDPLTLMTGLGAAALAQSALGHSDAAAALLTEVDATAGIREVQYYPAWLPSMVRTALAVDEPTLAQRLMDGVEPRHPYTEHALAAANAALTEHRGDLQAAGVAYADAAHRWEGFGVVPEHAFALLGSGRCLLAMGRDAQARPVLTQARALLEHLQAAPALAEIDNLLGEPTDLTS